MDQEFLPVAIMIAVGVAAAVAIIAFIRRRGQRLHDRLGPAFELGTSKPLRLFGAGIEGLYRGYSSQYVIQYASQHDRGGAGLRCDATSAITWSAERPRPGTRLLVTIGVLKDIETGDPELDQNFRFTSSDGGSLRSLVAIDSVRRALLQLGASENFESVRVRADRVDFKWSPRAAALDEDSDTLGRRLHAAIELMVACGLPPRLHAPS
jgi:hypothetical protein